MKFNLTFERLTVFIMVACIIVSDINWIDVPWWCGLLLLALYAYFEVKGMDEMKATIKTLKSSIGGGGIKDPKGGSIQSSVGGGGVKKPKP